MFKKTLIAGALSVTALSAHSAPVTIYFSGERDFTLGDPGALWSLSIPDEITGSFTIDPTVAPYFTFSSTTQDVARYEFDNFSFQFGSAASYSADDVRGLAVFDAKAFPFVDQVSAQIDPDVSFGSGLVDQVRLSILGPATASFAGTAVPTAAFLDGFSGFQNNFLDIGAIDPTGTANANSDYVRYVDLRFSSTSFTTPSHSRHRAG